MNWREKVWDHVLSTNFPGMPDSNLLSRLPPLSSLLTVMAKLRHISQKNRFFAGLFDYRFVRDNLKLRFWPLEACFPLGLVRDNGKVAACFRTIVL